MILVTSRTASKVRARHDTAMPCSTIVYSARYLKHVERQQHSTRYLAFLCWSVRHCWVNVQEQTAPRLLLVWNSDSQLPAIVYSMAGQRDAAQTDMCYKAKGDKAGSAVKAASSSRTCPPIQHNALEQQPAQARPKAPTCTLTNTPVYVTRTAATMQAAPHSHVLRTARRKYRMPHTVHRHKHQPAMFSKDSRMRVPCASRSRALSHVARLALHQDAH